MKLAIHGLVKYLTKLWNNYSICFFKKKKKKKPIPFGGFNPRTKHTLKVFLALLFSMLKECHGFYYFIIRGKKKKKKNWSCQNYDPQCYKPNLREKNFGQKRTWSHSFYLIAFSFFYLLNVQTNFIGGTSWFDVYTFQQKILMK